MWWWHLGRWQLLFENQDLIKHSQDYQRVLVHRRFQMRCRRFLKLGKTVLYGTAELVTSLFRSDYKPNVFACLLLSNSWSFLSPLPISCLCKYREIFEVGMSNMYADHLNKDLLIALRFTDSIKLFLLLLWLNVSTERSFQSGFSIEQNKMKHERKSTMYLLTSHRITSYHSASSTNFAFWNLSLVNTYS